MKNLEAKIREEIRLLNDDIQSNNNLIHPFYQSDERNEELREQNLIAYCTIKTLERLLEE